MEKNCRNKNQQAKNQKNKKNQKGDGSWIVGVIIT